MKKIFLLFILVFVFGGLRAQTSETVSFTCYFDYNSASFPKDSIAKLNAWLEPYMQKNGLEINLAAYTDTIGSIESNKALAQRRVDAVKKQLVQQNTRINRALALGEFYDLESYSNDKLHRAVEVKISFQENAPAEASGEQKVIRERMETFAASTEPVNLNIQFVGGEDVYIGDSYLDVVALLQYMKKNPTKKVFIRGHVCCENDLELSTRRAFAVYNDLILEGISADRVSYQGFGNSMPAVEEWDEFTRQYNRRVDVVFSEK